MKQFTAQELDDLDARHSNIYDRIELSREERHRLTATIRHLRAVVRRKRDKQPA